MAQNAPIGVVFDFDGTLSPKDCGYLIKIVDCACLSKSAKLRVERIRKKYLKLAAVGPVAPALDRQMMKVSLSAYTECGLTPEQWKSALSQVKLRKGVVEIAKGLVERGIKVGIISFGIAEFIESVLEVNGLAGVFHRIYAARFIYDERCNEVVGWNNKSIVYPFNKCIWSSVFAKQYGIPPERLLAVGDSTGDRLLGVGQKLRLGIAKNEEEAKILAPFMGDVVVTDDFHFVGEWINKKISLIR